MSSEVVNVPDVFPAEWCDERADGDAPRARLRVTASRPAARKWFRQRRRVTVFLSEPLAQDAAARMVENWRTGTLGVLRILHGDGSATVLLGSEIADMQVVAL